MIQPGMKSFNSYAKGKNKNKECLQMVVLGDEVGANVFFILLSLNLL